MTKPVRKPSTSAPGVKMLITAASLVATLGSWALISSTEAKPASAPAPDRSSASTVPIKLAPLPTLVPAITPQPRPQLVTINQPRPAASAPQPVASNEIVLRDVSAPQVNTGRSAAPAPVVNTGSSR